MYNSVHSYTSQAGGVLYYGSRMAHGKLDADVVKFFDYYIVDTETDKHKIGRFYMEELMFNHSHPKCVANFRFPMGVFV